MMYRLYHPHHADRTDGVYVCVISAYLLLCMYQAVLVSCLKVSSSLLQLALFTQAVLTALNSECVSAYLLLGMHQAVLVGCLKVSSSPL